jgi:hypothetical protein
MMITMGFEQQLYPAEIGMSPQFAMNRFKGVIAKYGQRKVMSESRFQKAREIWATAAFLTGLSKLTGKTYWVAPEYDSETPDTHGISFQMHPTYHTSKIRELLEIEVSTYEQHASGNLVETIKRKLDGKAYPPHYVLLMYVIRPGEKVNLEKVFQELSAEAFSVGEIFLVGSMSSGPKYIYKTVSLFGTKASVDFCLDDELAKTPAQAEMINWSRGLGDDRLIEDHYLLKLPDSDL